MEDKDKTDLLCWAVRQKMSGFKFPDEIEAIFQRLGENYNGR